MSSQTKKLLPLFGVLAVLVIALVAALVAVGCESAKEPAADPTSSVTDEVSSDTRSEENLPPEDVSSGETPTEEPTAEPTPTPAPTPSGDLTGDEISRLHATTKGTSKYPYYLNVNLTQNIVTVYRRDAEGYYTVPDRCFVCSAGSYNDGVTCNTPSGTFKTTDRYTWRALSGNVYGQYATRITGHILFHSVPYFKQDKATLEWEEYNKLGSNASAGCIRLAVIDVKWIFDNCPVGTTVSMYESNLPEPFAKPQSIAIDASRPDEFKGWDPTDPDMRNPWRREDDEGENIGDEVDDPAEA